MKQIAMIGTSLDSPGGMTAVVQSYKDAGLFERWPLVYIASYTKPGAAAQLRAMWAALRQLLPALVARRVGLIHVHSASRGSFWRKSMFCALARLFSVPYVFHLHSGEFPVFYGDECGPLGKRWVRWTLRGAARVVVLTPNWEAALRSIEPRARLKVVLNPVAVPPEPVPVRSRPQRIVFLGRLRQKKGVFDLVAAMPAVLAQHPQVKFCIAGDGDLDGVRAAARELGVEHALELPGWLGPAEKDAALQSADVLVLPSYFEGLPICVLEAMAVGVPVVASPVGGIPFALEEGRCGELVEAGRVDALSAALNRLLADEALRADFSARARRRAIERFSSASVATELGAMWHECASGIMDGVPAMSGDK
jgi:glycosyltransferase involved in cell wall biosynthesis